MATPTSGPTAPVPKDPQPTVDRIDELARRILSGDILLPKFQRSFVWSERQITTLLDSVARGYPIGSVLLWQSRQELRSENRIAGLEITLPRPDYPVNYLLDGQQRLSTICGAMYWDGSRADSRWNLAYDLQTQTFMHLNTTDEPPLHQIRLNKLSDPSVYFKHVAALDAPTIKNSEQLKERANTLFNRFKDYKIATVTLGDMALKDVAPIFERINSTGTPLTMVDLMRAATWSPEFDLVDTIEELLDALASKDFRGIDQKVVLRNLSASAGGGFTIDSIDDLRKGTPQSLKVAAADTQTSYLKMVDFLVTQIRVPSARIVPYSNQLTVLAEIFRRIPSPIAAQYHAIREWFWRTALSGYFSGWNTGQMAADLAAAKAFTDGESTSISIGATPPSQATWINSQFRSNNALTKALAIVLSHHQPIDLLTGQQVDTTNALAWNNQQEFHHFFPQDFLKRRGVSRRRANALANIVMLSSGSNKKISNRPPSEYLTEVEAGAGAALQTWLDSNLISIEAFEAAKADDFDRFLTLRAGTIHGVVLELAGWSKSGGGVSPGSEVGMPAVEPDDSDYTNEAPTKDITGGVGPE